MRRIVFAVALSAAILAVDRGQATAQVPLCALIGCPPGPQGPSGPQGSAGGFDPSSLYSKECLNTTACSCDAGDVLLSGGVQCDPGVSTLLVSIASSDGPLMIWNGLCHRTATGDTEEPPRIRITCAVP
jgi:hypothetical protein